MPDKKFQLQHVHTENRRSGTRSEFPADRLLACRFCSPLEPAFQRKGIGTLLMDIAEKRAREAGAIEVALDTAEPARQLKEYYSRRGYRFIEFHQWEGKTYRSVVMSKTLVAREEHGD